MLMQFILQTQLAILKAVFTFDQQKEMFNTNLAYLHMIDTYMLKSLAALIIASYSSSHSYVYSMCCI